MASRVVEERNAVRQGHCVETAAGNGNFAKLAAGGDFVDGSFRAADDQHDVIKVRRFGLS